MSDDKEIKRHTIEIAEITRVEGHSAVHVDIVDGKVEAVQLDVFEGTRFFEKIVLGHNYTEIPHITSRVCAICSTGHVLAASIAVEKIFGIECDAHTQLFRRIMHMGMFIESHSTHIYALALPDFVEADDLLDFASRFKNEFTTWTKLRNLGTLIQTIIGGRPFHPVNLQVNGLSYIPQKDQLEVLITELQNARQLAIDTCELLMKFNPPIEKTSPPLFMALIPKEDKYGYFGSRVRSSNGFEADVEEYKTYLDERSVPYSHAKKSGLSDDKLFVGAMARLNLFGNNLENESLNLFNISPFVKGDFNSIWNNLAQSIEIVYAVDKCIELLKQAIEHLDETKPVDQKTIEVKDGAATGAIECPRGTLYHFYRIDESGKITMADMVTPSAQNTARIESDIKFVVEQCQSKDALVLQKSLETLVRAYDPCNTCATHMVSISYS